MTRTSVSDVLARANAAMVGPDLDVTGALARLLAGVTSSLPATAAAVLVDTDGSLEVLAATSHRALDLEMHQATGMVVAQLGVPETDALALLRAYAYSHDQSVATTAHAVITRTLAFSANPDQEIEST